MQSVAPDYGLRRDRRRPTRSVLNTPSEQGVQTGELNTPDLDAASDSQIPVFSNTKTRTLTRPPFTNKHLGMVEGWK